MQNEPVVVSGAVTILTAILTPILVKYNISSDGVQQLGAAVGAIVTAVISVLAVFHARSKVTPVAKQAPATAPTFQSPPAA